MFAANYATLFGTQSSANPNFNSVGLPFTVYRLRPSSDRRHTINYVRRMARGLIARNDPHDLHGDRLLRLVGACAYMMGAIDHRIILQQPLVRSLATRR